MKEVRRKYPRKERRKMGESRGWKRGKEGDGERVEDGREGKRKMERE